MAVLEASVTSKTRENMKNQPKNSKKQAKKVLVVAQELKLARILAGNDKTRRDKALKGLEKWFQSRSTTLPFTEDDFLRLWKGLFYSMWMSDKPLIQEECAENISKLLHALPLDASVLFYKCGMTILMNEWFGIEQLRLDKFLMFIRRLLRQALFVLKNDKWRRSSVQKFTRCLSETILEPHSRKPMGLVLHFIEIFLEELSKVSEGHLGASLTTDFVAPFIKQLAFSNDLRIIDHIRKHVFVYLIRQSNLGLEYDDKYRAWRSLGFPGSINSMKRVEQAREESEDDEDEEAETEENGEKVYDPRAGNVDVDLAQIKFSAKEIAKALSDCKFEKDTNSKSRKCISELMEHFKKLASGIYPLGIKKVKLAADDGYDTNIRKAVNRLVKFEQKVQGKKKKKKRKNDDSHEIELRNGKKIKLDDGLTQKVQEEFDRVAVKRKTHEDVEAPPPKKLPKKDEPKLQIESIFRRNSGTWLVTKAVQKPPKKKTFCLTDQWQDGGSLAEIDAETSLNPDVSSDGASIDAIFVEEPKERQLFPKNQWETSMDELAVSVENSLKRGRLSLPLNLIKNPFASSSSSASSPVKKVKINTKLNQSQDVKEHRAQIFSSPDIPYDPEKKPAKPLLKTPLKQSPINPFYLS